MASAFFGCSKVCILYDDDHAQKLSEQNLYKLTPPPVNHSACNQYYVRPKAKGL